MTIDHIAAEDIERRDKAETTELAFQIAICMRKRHNILPLQDYFRNMQIAIDYFSNGSIRDYLAQKEFTENDIRFMNADPNSFFCFESIGYDLRKMKLDKSGK